MSEEVKKPAEENKDADETGSKTEEKVGKVEEKDGKLIAEGYTANYVRTFGEVEGMSFTRGDIIHGTVKTTNNENLFVVFK